MVEVCTYIIQVKSCLCSCLGLIVILLCLLLQSLFFVDVTMRCSFSIFFHSISCGSGVLATVTGRLWELQADKIEADNQTVTLNFRVKSFILSIAKTFWNLLERKLFGFSLKKLTTAYSSSHLCAAKLNMQKKKIVLIQDIVVWWNNFFSLKWNLMIFDKTRNLTLQNFKMFRKIYSATMWITYRLISRMLMGFSIFLN